MVMDQSEETFPETEKKLVALALIKMIELTLSNHLYQFEEKLYLQLKGGLIGYNLTQLMAKAIMYNFVDK